MDPRHLSVPTVLLALLLTGCPQPGGGAGPVAPGTSAPPPPILTDAGWWGLWEVVQDGYTVQWFFGSRKAVPLTLAGQEVKALSPLGFVEFNGISLTAREMDRESGTLSGDLWHFKKVSPRRLTRTFRDPVTSEERDYGRQGFLKGRTPDGRLSGTVKALLAAGGASRRALDLGSLSDIKVLIRDLKNDLEEKVIVPEPDGTFTVPEVVPEAPVSVEIIGVPEGSGQAESLLEAQTVPLTGEFDAGYFTLPPPEEGRKLKLRLVPVYSHPSTGDATEDVRLLQFPLSSLGSRPRWNLWVESASVPPQTLQGPVIVTVESPLGRNFLEFFIKGNNTAVEGSKVTFSSAGPPGSGARAELVFDPPDFQEDFKDFPLEFRITLPDQAGSYTDRIPVRIWKSHLPVKILSDGPLTVLYTTPEGSTRALTGTGTPTRVYRLDIPGNLTGGFQALAFYSASGAKVSLGLGTDTLPEAELKVTVPEAWEEPNDTEEAKRVLVPGQEYHFSVSGEDWDYFTW